MKRTHKAILTFCWLLCSFSALAEHRTHLRGVVNIPGLQMALLEIDHTLAKPSNAPPVMVTESRVALLESNGTPPKLSSAPSITPTGIRVARVPGQFEDDMVKGAHFNFELLELDLARETMRTREAGEEHAYALPVTSRPSSARSWVHFQDAAFADVMGLYSRLEDRVLLVHPALDRAPVSLQAVWTNQVPERVDVAKFIRNYLNQRGTSAIRDGKKFLQLVPSNITHVTAQRSKDLPVSAAEMSGGMLNGEPSIIAMFYGQVSGRRYVEGKSLSGTIRLDIDRPLSKPEVLYALETLWGWQGLKIRLDSDDTFTIVRADEVGTSQRQR